MDKTICLKTDGTFFIVAHAYPGKDGEFQWFLLDDPNTTESRRNLENETYESIVLSNDSLDMYKNKWLCCKCEVDGEKFTEGCIFLTDDFAEIISSNQFDEIKICDEEGNFRGGISYCKKNN